GRDILEAPDPLLLLAPRIDAPAAGAAVEHGAVAALEFPLAVVRFPGGGAAIGEQPRLAPSLLRGEQHRGALADELAGARADHVAQKRRAVLAPQLPFQVALPARGKDRHRDLAERLVALAAGVHHLAGLADQLVRAPAEHLGEPRVAEKHAPLAGEGDADRGVGEQRLVFKLRIPGAPGIALPRRLERGLDAAQGGVVHRGGCSGAAWPARSVKSSA